MKLVSPEFATRFQCAAGRCPDTCCQNWQIAIDPQAAAYYRALPGALGEQVRAAIEDGDAPCFRLKNGCCALLDEDGLCHLQRNLGEGALCADCRKYPRFTREYGGLLESGLNLSCPEVVRLVLSDPSPIAFAESFNTQSVTNLNTIDGSAFLALKNARHAAFRLLQNRSLSISQRVFLLLKFADAAQYALNRKDYPAVERLCVKLLSPLGRKAELRKTTQYRFGNSLCCSILSSWLDIYTGLETLTQKWPTLLEKLDVFLSVAAERAYYRTQWPQFVQARKAQSYEYEHYLICTLFKYWLEASDDGQLLPRVKYTVVSMLLLRELNFMQWLEKGQLLPSDQVETMHLMAREIEHSEENLNTLLASMDSERCFRTEALLQVAIV